MVIFPTPTTSFASVPSLRQEKTRSPWGVRIQKYFLTTQAPFRGLDARTIQASPPEPNQALKLILAALQSSKAALFGYELRLLLLSIQQAGIATLFQKVLAGRKEHPHMIPNLLQLLQKDEIVEKNCEEDPSEYLTLLGKVLALDCSHSTHSTGTRKSTTRGWLGTFLYALSFFGPSSQPSGSWEAAQYIEVIAKFIGIPLLLFTALCAFCAVWIAALSTTVTIALIVITVLTYQRYFAHCPDQLPHSDNLSLLGLSPHSFRIMGRERDIERVLDTMRSASLIKKRFPLLIGPSQVGKTSIIQAIAQRNGDLGFELLKNKKIMRVNLGDIIAEQTYAQKGDLLARCMREFIQYQDEVVPFLDEVHHLFGKEKLYKVIQEDLKKIPYLICATTDEEYAKLLQNSESRPFINRLQPVKIRSLDETGTIAVLKELARASGFSPDGCEKGVFEMIYRETQKKTDAVQPDAACQLLAESLASHQKEQEGTKSDDQLRSLLTQVEELNGKREVESLKKRLKIEKQIKKIRTAATNDLQQRKELQALRTEEQQLLVQIDNIAREHAKAGTLQQKRALENTYLFIKHQHRPFLQQQIQEKEQHAALPSHRLTTAFVQQFIEKRGKEKE